MQQGKYMKLIGKVHGFIFMCSFANSFMYTSTPLSSHQGENPLSTNLIMLGTNLRVLQIKLFNTPTDRGKF